MIFENLWPLFFLAAIPVIIILYLLKPRGKDYLISSNLLWKKLLNNEQSRTFFEKFVHNLLMYLQILIVLLLTIALMSPFFRINGQAGGRKILLLDTSGSMQHKNSSGISRFEETISKARQYIKDSENSKISLVTCDALGTNLLAIDSTDKDRLLELLRGLSPNDCGGDLSAAQNLLDQLALTGEGETARLIVGTDSQGASSFDNLKGFTEKELWLTGEPVKNVSNDYIAFSAKENGLYDIIVSTTNHSEENVSFDVSLMEENGALLSVKQMALAPKENNICLFSDISWNGETCSALLSGISFADGAKDSLEADNKVYTIKDQSKELTALLIGDGNTYLEKAYQAITGSPVTKAATDAGCEAYRIQIYDTEQKPGPEAKNILRFIAAKASEKQTNSGGTDSAASEKNNSEAAGSENTGANTDAPADTNQNKTGNTNTDTGISEILQNVVITTQNCDLTAGLSDFNIGVNAVNVFALPEWAKPFLEYNGKCVGYYGEHDGIREIITGFDIRESDFPLRPEFPIFLANAMTYLSNTSWLVSNIYYAGEKIALQPWADPDADPEALQTGTAGLYQIGNQEYQEYYTVRFQTATESDGTLPADSQLSQTGSSDTDTQAAMQKVTKTLRNVFLILAILLLILEWLYYVKQMRYRGKFYLSVRGVVMLILLLALFGPEISKKSTRTTTIFLVDLSNSNAAHQEELSNYLKKTIQQMPAHNQYGIVTFGKNTLIEQFLTKNATYGGLMTVPEKTATNFEEAISKAFTLIPGEDNGRLVLLTDGKETNGDIHRLTQAVTTGNVELLTLLYESESKQDAYIENVTLPSYLHPGDLYSVTVLVESNYDTDADILLYHGSNQAKNSRVHLNKGSNRFVFQEQVTDELMESLMVKINADGDSCPENDTFNAYSVVESAPKILVVSGMDTQTAAFTSVLNTAGSDYSVVSAYNAPSDINAMLDYKCIVLADVYIDDLPGGFLQNIESYVKDYGCGFVCCGGEDSFALGGYRDTVLETILPVDMQPRSMNEVPSMAMVMVIDRSGSMLSPAEGTNVDQLTIAMKAATVAVDNLRKEDYVGVLSFDDQYKWEVEIQTVADRESIKNKINRIAGGGGTTIKPALTEAFRRISDCDASVKHVVLLTDGMGETTDFKDIIENYRNNNITLSTVAVGEGSDTQLLEHLAKKCNGRYYYSDVSSDIPKIFAQEVFLGGEMIIQNGDFPLLVHTGHELTQNLFPEGWPNLFGYLSSTPKAASSRIIVSAEKEDPILTVWQYGLGRTVAWNSDITGEWSALYSGKEDYVQLWKRILDYSTGNANLGDDSVNVITAGETTEITYTTDHYDGQTKILANVIDPNGNAEEITLHATAPGKYEAALDTDQTGLYHFNIRRQDHDSITNYMTTAAAVQFSDEYKFNVSTDSYLSFMEKHGKLIRPEDYIWNKIRSKNREKYSLTNLLLALGILLFLSDIAMRRFQYVPKPQNFRKLSGRKRKENTNPDNRKNSPDNSDNPPNPLPETEFTNDTIPSEQPKKTKETKAAKKAAKKTEKKEAEQTLDTSLLLKKKDDRNREH